MKLSDGEKRDLIRSIENNVFLPEKYRFSLFKNPNQVELNWNGKSYEVNNVVLPFQIIEQVDEPRNEDNNYFQSELIDLNTGRQLKGWTNKLIWGDNKYILSSLKNGPMREEIERQGGIKLIYIDPPFDVGANFSMNLNIGENSYEKKPNVLEQIAYRDTWGLGADSFLSMIYERLILMKDLLADDGSIYVQIDWRLNSPIRLVLDEIFGKNRFRSEINWEHQGSWVEPTNNYPRRSQQILYYSKSDKYTFNRIYEDIKTDKGVVQRWKSFIKDNKIYANNAPYHDGKFHPYINKFEKLNKRLPKDKDIIVEFKGRPVGDSWYVPNLNPISKENYFYPTQKPEQLLERILLTSSNEKDLICDFFGGSGTTAAVAEKLNRKWICSDLGKFAIHTTRKRLINVQRSLKESLQNWRAFEILNLGKYQRQHFIYNNKDKKHEGNQIQIEKREKDFEELILTAYKSESVSSFRTIHGKKGTTFVSIGPVNQPLSRNHVEEVISECIKNEIISVDILGFEYEMGLFPTIQEEAKNRGLRLTYKQIPMDIFDKRAVEKNEVYFHDVAFIDFRVNKNGNNLTVELTDFAVFYSEDNINIHEKLKKGRSKVIVENGNIIEKSKDNEGNISDKLLTNSWIDWIDYWSVDFNYESKKEIIKIRENDQVKEIWTGNYVFENEWQSFRTFKKGDNLELKSSERTIDKEFTKIAVKVIDIFGNDTMKLLEVKM